uniref:hypothetical protein n=1 Tax=Aureivirga marina TaxID=1182451 RepID=UPI0018C9FF39
MKHNYLVLVLFFLIKATLYAQEPTDAENAITVCGDLNMSLNSNGTGINDFSNPNNFPPDCGFTESQSLWIKVVINTGGTLGFTLTSNNGTDDYDFAVYGPNVTFDNLGSPIRCSATNPQAAGVPALTGMNGTETDTSEGPGAAGNGFVQWLTVTSGEEYYLLLDNWNQQDGATLEWTGTATFPDSPNFLNPLNISYDQEKCDTDGLLNNSTEFDLTLHESTFVGTQANVAVTYHQTLDDAQIGDNAISNPTTYENLTSPQTIYVRMENTIMGCFSVHEFQLEIEGEIAFTPEDFVICGDGDFTEFNLSEYTTELANSVTFDNASYFLSEADALNNSNPLANFYTNISNPQTIWVKLDANSGSCSGIKPFDLVVNENPEANTPLDLETCMQEGVFQYTFDLTFQNDAINSEPNTEITYFDNLGNEITDPVNYTVTSSQIINFSVENTITNCRSVGSFNIIILDAPTIADAPNILACDYNEDGVNTWNLTEFEAILTDGGNFAIKYYETLADISTDNFIINPSVYISGNAEIFYVLSNAAAECDVTDSFFLILNEIPQIEDSYSYDECVTVETTIVPFDLQSFIEGELSLPTGTVVGGFYQSYDASLPDNEFPLSDPILDTSNYVSSGETIYFSVIDTATGCWSIASLFLNIQLIPQINDDISHYEICDDDYNGFALFNLTIKETEILQPTEFAEFATVKYYNSEADALSDTNEITGTDIVNYQNATENVHQVWVSVSYDDSECYEYTSFYVIVHPKPLINSVSNIEMCDDGDGAVTFDLTNGATTAEILNGQNGISITYFTDLNEANQAVIDEVGGNTGSFAYIAAPDAFENTITPIQTIYAVLKNDVTGCGTVTPFNIEVLPQPTL